MRDHGLPFRSAHGIAALLLKARTEDPGVSLVGGAQERVNRDPRTDDRYSDDELQQILSPSHFVRGRTTHGGPAPSETSRALTESRRLLIADRQEWTARREHLDRAEAALMARVKQL